MGEAAGGGAGFVVTYFFSFFSFFFFLVFVVWVWVSEVDGASDSWVLGVSCLAQKLWIRYTPQSSVARGV